jgi:hypothetical protein
MTLGIGAFHCRLDSDVPVAVGGISWTYLEHWTGALPANAGKYMIGSPWRWVHIGTQIARGIPATATIDRLCINHAIE